MRSEDFEPTWNTTREARKRKTRGRSSGKSPKCRGNATFEWQSTTCRRASPDRRRFTSASCWTATRAPRLPGKRGKSSGSWRRLIRGADALNSFEGEVRCFGTLAALHRKLRLHAGLPHAPFREDRRRPSLRQHDVSAPQGGGI